MEELWSLIQRGGWPMIPLGICSLAGATIIIERALALRRPNVIDPRVLEAMEDYRGEDGAEIAAHRCRRARGPLAHIIGEVLQSRGLDHAQAIEIMNAAGRAQLARLDRGLTLLEIIAAVSPLLGLLGTVLGMVSVFNAITAQGLGDPQVLSDGISEALITTVAGLCVAIPALAFHSLLTKRVDQLAAEMQNLATAFLVKTQSRPRE